MTKDTPVIPVDRLNEVHENESWIDGGCGANAYTWLIKINILEQISFPRITLLDCPHDMGCLCASSITKLWHYSLRSGHISCQKYVMYFDLFADYFRSDVASISLSIFLMAHFQPKFKDKNGNENIE